jgi:hypothetical protein
MLGQCGENIPCIRTRNESWKLKHGPLGLAGSETNMYHFANKCPYACLYLCTTDLISQCSFMLIGLNNTYDPLVTSVVMREVPMPLDDLHAHMLDGGSTTSPRDSISDRSELQNICNEIIAQVHTKIFVYPCTHLLLQCSTSK